MSTGFAAVPSAPSFRLTQARVPLCLVAAGGLAADRDGLTLVDLAVEEGRIASILPAGTEGLQDGPVLDLDGGIVLPRLVDCHVHLDKGHIWPRRRNPDGSFMGALNSVMADREANWSATDVRARMAFGLRCALAHGTAAVRTHIDSLGKQIGLSWPVLAELRAEWAGRIAVQGSPLFGIQFALDAAHVRDVVAAVKAHGDRLFGCVSYMIPELDAALDVIFRTAIENGFDLDFHVDETNDAAARSLEHIADAAIRHRFTGKILAGHCCSLALQEPEAEARIIAKVREAGIAVVSLPMCNMYLQDRTPGRTPRWRGVTALHELKTAGVPVMIASDNTRDPFYAYGDLDLIEVLREGTRILQLDHAGTDWANAVARTPASLMGLDGKGVLSPGSPADLILTRARDWTEFFARPQSDRTVLVAGRAIDTTLPDHRELDHLMGGRS
ncbi:cytosine deaminase [Bosea sp. (in: a-proteobacteria)]|uniref:cytosine deaminase n=1 Tax=Bosea sp. (in: a-proteobacteria) TaxID=1871050 RepID=UPI002736028D|nr:cytosine deaminase [Bosea sp. (in: a-proteobacteria)]MDP3411266.1 cytosine deaminase [Bosea sp. (in: a-proteobacteria)]